MSEMVKRVAQALFREALVIKPGEQQAFVDAMFADPDPNCVGGYFDAAHDAIEAMREPTPHMVAKGAAEYGTEPHIVRGIWSAAIDAALQENPPTT